MKHKKSSNDHPEDKKNFLEWIVFSLSLLLICGIVGYLIYQITIYKPGSPDLAVVYVADPSPHAPYRYFLRIRNEGQETAKEVQVEMVLETDGIEVEVATMSFPYLPKQSVREGWVNFSQNPSKSDTLYSRIISYTKP